MEVLNGKDKRVELIETLLNTNKVIISLRTNYPGINKDNESTRYVINIINSLIKKSFSISECFFLNEGEGYVYLYLLDTSDSNKVKLQTIEIEDNHLLGRLVDIDVYYKNIKSYSRKDLNKARRQCFLCKLDAFYCIRNSSHNLEELESYFIKVVKEYERSTVIS